MKQNNEQSEGKFCCEAFEEFIPQFGWFKFAPQFGWFEVGSKSSTAATKKDEQICLMPYLQCGEKKMRINYCPSCGKYIRDIRISEDELLSIIL